jgi:hypothetical protein
MIADVHARIRAYGSLAQEVADTGTAGVVAMAYNVYVSPRPRSSPTSTPTSSPAEASASPSPTPDERWPPTRPGSSPSNRDPCRTGWSP